jgi:hypothetical protein
MRLNEIICLGLVWLLLSCGSHYSGEANLVKDSSATINENNEKDSLMKEVRLFPDNIGLAVPSDWIKTDQNGSVILKPNCKKDKKFCPNIVVSMIPSQKEIGLKQYAEILAEKVEAEFDQYSVINVEELKIRTNDALLMDYKVLSDSTHLGGTTALIRNEGKICMVNCMAINEPAGAYSKHRDIFLRVIHSVIWK